MNPPFTGIHQNVTNDVKRWTLCDRKAQNVNAFSCKRRKQHALKGQKLTAQGNALGIKQLAGQKTQAARPEGAEAHSPGQRPGYKAISNAPCKGKSFKTPGNFLKLLPLQVGCVGQTFERGIWQQNHGSECDYHGSECDKHGSEKREKKQQKKDRFSEKMIIFAKWKQKALTELSALLEVEVTDLLWEDNIDW